MKNTSDKLEEHLCILMIIILLALAALIYAAIIWGG